ncbi:MAG: SDR family oxidoreductase [Planctomycetes bacterium]|nr:SDR family oxidoreductase [Planctomycetota bacterium]
MTRKIVITGASRGLGRALTDRFVEKGHEVAGCGRSKEHAQQLRKRYPAPHSFSAVDVSSDAEVSAWAKDVLDNFGVPDLLINNASVINRSAKLWELSADEFDTLMQINVSGMVNVIRAFVPAMIEANRGVIVNLSSGWGSSAAPEVAPYCASKFATEGFSKALAQELPKTIASIPLSPGIIDTDMLRTTFGEGAAQYDNADAWSYKAADFILNLDASHSGKSMRIP